MARGRRPPGGGTRSGLTVSIEGLERLRPRLSELAEEIVTALRKAVRESAEDVRRETLLNVRKDTGTLQRKLDIRYKAEGLRAEVGWFDRDAYYAAFQEFGTKSITARPALGPAIEAERNRIKDRLSDELRRELGL
ncbi:HK97-gp10 family putative phage morphogenesis protein [Kitasatospora sp. MBT63]|uniref:HK97-gp10 family putative phage morphogenesis protein n=1 Tax=Kitasatospora sp. MBT63 TaxID=1444768 RepID=UPI00053A9E8A|nr:HK97-gp10 family putative phage morphogenesis protein [Kitasatospora sp. MBT63]